MSAHIRNLEISNFKSVRSLKLECERINVFIGKPNAGKSNILEAISLLGAGYSRNRFMDGFIRYKSIIQLFSDFRFDEPIRISIDNFFVELKDASNQGGIFDFTTKHDIHPTKVNNQFALPFHAPIRLNNEGTIIENEGFRVSPVKKYEFTNLGDFKQGTMFLQPPNGSNFFMVVRSNSGLRDEIQQFLKPNGMELLIDEESQRILVVRKENGVLISFPIHLVPDTFKRYIFHLAAILSNKDSVLLFEEPETHSYVPYVYQLAQHIIDDDRNNQYFLTTHNPYLLTPIMQEAKDVAIFVTWFEDYQTHARRLTEEEISEMLNYGVDIFLNLDQFIPA